MNKKRLSIILGIGLIAALVIFFVTDDDDDEPTPEPEMAEVISDPPADESPKDAPKVLTPPLNHVFVEKLNVLKFPSTAQYNAELANDPEGLPQSVVNSIVQMDDALEALKTEADGKLFLNRMQDCAKEDELIPASVKTNCLNHASKVVEKLPQLKSQLESLRASASKEALRLEAITNNENGEQENLLNK